jgi:hypothetical protein
MMHGWHLISPLQGKMYLDGHKGGVYAFLHAKKKTQSNVQQALVLSL